MKISPFLFLVIVFLTTKSYAQPTNYTLSRDVTQKKTIGLASIQIYYSFKHLNKEKHLKTGKSDYYTDRRVLQLGDGFSKCWSLDADMQDSARYNAVLTNQKNIQRVLFGNQVPLWAEFYKNYPKGKLTVTTRFHNTDYEYQEDMPVMNWVVQSETLTVLNYQCQKATCHFRGRDYIAWFTVEVPIGNGPWKFGGLPGLILKVYDSNNEFIFECTAIEKASEPIYYIVADYKKLTRKQLMRIDKYRHNDVIGYFKSVGVQLTIAGVDTSIPYQVLYNPMELE